MATKAKKESRLSDIMSRRAEFRASDESKLASFHLGALLMERNVTRKLGFRLFHVALDAEIIARYSRQIAAYALQDCNHGLTEGQEKTRAKLAAQVKEVASWYDLTASCSGDPRGYVVRLDGEGVEKNGWGDGFGVA